jgi:hypothetical protein
MLHISGRQRMFEKGALKKLFGVDGKTKRRLVRLKKKKQ